MSNDAIEKKMAASFLLVMGQVKQAACKSHGGKKKKKKKRKRYYGGKLAQAAGPGTPWSSIAGGAIGGGAIGGGVGLGAGIAGGSALGVLYYIIQKIRKDKTSLLGNIGRGALAGGLAGGLTGGTAGATIGGLGGWGAHELRPYKEAPTNV